MSQVAVITDTDSSLPFSVAEALNIQQVPISINFGDESFASDVDIDDRRLFERIDREGCLPTTAAPHLLLLRGAFKTAFENGASSIVCICVSSKISTTYNSALTAVCEEFRTA